MVRALKLLIWLVYFQATLRSNSAKFRHHVGSSYKYRYINETVPKECEELGYCEKASNYPTELAEEFIRELRASNVFLDTDVGKTPQSGCGTKRQCTGLCNLKHEKIKPLMVREVVGGKWYYALNSIADPVYEFCIETCVYDLCHGKATLSCRGMIALESNFKSKCLQKYITRDVMVIKNKKLDTIPTDIPCCCSCVAVKVY